MISPGEAGLAHYDALHSRRDEQWTPWSCMKCGTVQINKEPRYFYGGPLCFMCSALAIEDAEEAVEAANGRRSAA